MPKPKDDFAPIINAYYDILDMWLAQIPLPSWKTDLFQNKRLQASVFQSFIMYPFQVGESEVYFNSKDQFYSTKIINYSQKQISLYKEELDKEVYEVYAQERCLEKFLFCLKNPKANIRAREGNKRYPRIPKRWTDLIVSAAPWERSASPKIVSLVAPYVELLERICLQASEAEKNDLDDKFFNTKQICSSAYFSDLMLALSLGYAASPSVARQHYVTCAAEHLAALLMRCAGYAEKLVEMITQKYSEGELADPLGKISGNRPFPAIVTTAYNLLRAELQCGFRTADSNLFNKKAHTVCSEKMWYLYQQYFSKPEPASAQKVSTFFIDTKLEREFCTLMSEKLDHYPLAVGDGKPKSVLECYFEQMYQAALLLYLGIYLHFKSGNTQLVVKNDDLAILSAGNYIAPIGLPLTTSSLRSFVSKYSPCLLCGGSGSGKSTYLKKIMELQKKGTTTFSLVAYIPLRFLVSEKTPQLDSIEPTLETSLIWQKVRQYILQKNPSAGQKILAKAEANLVNTKEGVAPILLLLDGYNEILSIQNEMALERLQADIKWLTTKSNIRIIITYRTEQIIREGEIRRSMNWLFSPGQAHKNVFYLTYDKAKMMELLKGTWVLTHGVPKRFMELLENRPMYLLAAKELEHLTPATQYALLDNIYNQRCQAGLDSPLIRDGMRPHWMALYYVILPELAYHMVASGNQILERHELHAEIRKILTGHNESIKGCEDFGSLYWWNIRETCDEIGSYPFHGSISERDIAWIERALLGSDKIIDKEETGAIGFFHEDIRNYLAAKHIAHRFRLYCKCSKLQCCYDLPIRWERIPREMRSLVYEALAEEFDISLHDTGKAEAIQILQELVFPSAKMPARPESMLPGDWMRLKLASQMQEYEKQDCAEVMRTFADGVRQLADSCVLDQDHHFLPEKAREILSWMFCRLSQFERLDGKHPVPDKAFQYTELAVKLASDIPTVVGESSIKKITQHYLAKTVLYQAQYLWTQCPEQDWSKADSAFRRGCSMLKACADGDRINPGLNLSNNLLGLWKYAPAPYLQQKPVFREEIGDIDYSAAFFYFLRSLAFSPAKSANRAYAATKCAAMLLEQQVYLSSMLTFTSLEELWVQLCDNQGHIMTAETAGHGILPLEAPELRVNVQLIGLLLKEAERFAVDERSYYKGLYLLYCAEQIKLQAIDWDKIQEEFEGDQKNLLKDKLCLAFIEANNCLSQGHKRKAKTAWKGAKKAFLEDAQKEFQEIPPHDTGSLDAGHRIHNKVAYNNLLHMLSSQIEKMML